MDAINLEKVTDAGQAFRIAEKKLGLRLVADALEAYHKAEELGFDANACAGARWLCHMLRGDFSRAWKESDAIESRGRPDPNRFWSGHPLAGKHLIVRCLHGLGDTLQFVRYLPLLRPQVASLTLETPPSLTPLLTCTPLADEIVSWSDQPPFWDAQIEIVELPRIFRTTLATIPNRVPYLRVPEQTAQSGRPIRRSPVRVGESCSCLGDRTGASCAAETLAPLPRGKLHVGLVWASSAYNPARSIGLAQLAGLLDLPACEFYSLQAGRERDQLAEVDAAVHDRGGSVLQAASTLASLDLLITVDTMMAHLAGALGVRVWTLLPFEADWRWMLDRDDSPWYPTMRLFRQPVAGDWDNVVARVRQELIAAAVQAA